MNRRSFVSMFATIPFVGSFFKVEPISEGTLYSTDLGQTLNWIEEDARNVQIDYINELFSKVPCELFLRDIEIRMGITEKQVNPWRNEFKNLLAKLLWEYDGSIVIAMEKAKEEPLFVRLRNAIDSKLSNAKIDRSSWPFYYETVNECKFFIALTRGEFNCRSFNGISMETGLSLEKVQLIYEKYKDRFTVCYTWESADPQNIKYFYEPHFVKLARTTIKLT